MRTSLVSRVNLEKLNRYSPARCRRPNPGRQFSAQVHHQRPAQRAQDDHGRDDSGEIGIGPKSVQVVAAGGVGQDGEAGVVESRYRQEQRLPGGLSQRHVGHRPHLVKNQRRADEVAQHEGEHDVAGDPGDVGGVAGADGVAVHLLFQHGRAAAEKDQHGGRGHELQPAHEHQEKEHNLAGTATRTSGCPPALDRSRSMPKSR